MKVIGWIYLIFLVLFMGLRPISGKFVDMMTYNRLFQHYAIGGSIRSPNDIAFHIFTQISSQIMSAKIYFLVCATLYVVPLFYVAKKWFKDYWFYALLFLVTSFSFWAYGTNGIRNGIAGSLFLLGMSRDKRVWQITIILLAIGFHKSMLIPAAAFLLANFYNKPKVLIYGWLFCIPLSLVAGGLFTQFFGTLGLEDERLAYFAGENKYNVQFAGTGFRWDFLLYSATAVFAGWFYIFKRNYNDKIYFWLFNTYIIANAFWILVIRASFSNRFAYLSWFMIALVILYPLLKHFIVDKQHKKIGLLLLAYSGFTLVMILLKRL
ncbi:EpsG family protein [Aequorivita marina]|uniref:EpsG family protein n=1 Tax=Aequorivita marina TaxID=3073654 RepID=UPI0028760924|nr:EpsG family protein [Aequorivita sp. S2608]MDS1299045.1 EpsG family protein [Aequorivita sp. S2608]